MPQQESSVLLSELKREETERKNVWGQTGNVKLTSFGEKLLTLVIFLFSATLLSSPILQVTLFCGSLLDSGRGASVQILPSVATGIYLFCSVEKVPNIPSKCLFVG